MKKQPRNLSKLSVKKFVLACPKCGSVNFHTENGAAYYYSGKPGFYLCDDCGFSAPQFPKISEEERKKLSKNKPIKNLNKGQTQPEIKNTKMIFIAVASIIGFVFLGILGFIIVAGVYFAIRKYLGIKNPK